MSDDQNRNDYTKETDDYLSRFDEIYDRISSEDTDAGASSSPAAASPVVAGRVSRLNEKKRKAAFTSRRAKEERKAAREMRASGSAEHAASSAGVVDRTVPADTGSPTYRAEAAPKKTAPAEKNSRSFGQKVSDVAAEIVAAAVVAHRRMHDKPEKTVKRVDRTRLREETAGQESSVLAARSAGDGVSASDATMVIDSAALSREQARIDAANDTAMSQTKDTKKKKKQKPVQYKKNGKPKRHIFLKIVLSLVALGVLCCLGVGIWVLSIVKDTPDINPNNLYDMLSENTIVYDSNGEILEYIYDSSVGLRTNLSFNELPEDLVDAFVAIEDKTFWKHHGFNFVRIVGAIVDSLKTGDPIGGTSTITQQLARNLYLVETKSVHSYVRKIQEAYYTLILERELSKEQILEAYLNTIYLGQNSYGIYAASQTYFSKDVSDLNLAECALLASIPKSPYKNAPFTTLANSTINDLSLYDVIYRDSSYTVVYQANYRNRLEQVLKNMEEQEKISHEERESALAFDLRSSINPSREKTVTVSSYFADYVQSQVKTDLMNEYNISSEEASDMLKTGGLRIYSTIDVKMQQVADAEFEKPENFPTLINMDTDSAKNILNKDGEVMLYYLGSYFDADGNFILKPDEFNWLDNGDMIVYRGKRLNIYKVTSNGETIVQLEFKNLYTDEDGSFCQMNGGVVKLPASYASRDDSGNLIIAKAFFQDSNYKTLFSKQDDGTYKIASGMYTLRQKTIQPQSAMVITDYHTGEIKCMVGGRSASGKLLYNRALSTRQPGSSIKPFTVYGAALQRSYDLVSNASASEAAALKANGKIFTAATVLDDSPTLNAIGEIWPKNSYTGYRGLYSLRRSVEQSVNVNAVRVQTSIGNDVSIAYAQKFGISSFVTDESKAANDLNPSALALGGMVNGVSTLEMASAYGTYPNGGIYQEPICYTKVTNKMGDILLEKTSKATAACDPGVAFIMTDILRTTVSNGIANNAAFSSQVVGGKTGTTSDKFDIWFDGFTPYYSASLWIGNDTNIELSAYSSAAASLWSKIMSQVHEGLEKGTYKSAPSNVTSVTVDTQSGKRPSELTSLDPRGATLRTEYFLVGTEPDGYDDAHVEVEICSESGFLATDACRAAGCAATVIRVKHPEGSNLIYAGKKLSDTFCLPLSYSYTYENGSVFHYPEDLHLNWEVTSKTRFESVKYLLTKEVVEDITDRYGYAVTYRVGDYDYAAPVYYCYIHNNSPLVAFPIDPNVIRSSDYVVPDAIRRAVDPTYEEYTGSEEGLEVVEEPPAEDPDDPYSDAPWWWKPSTPSTPPTPPEPQTPDNSAPDWAQNL